MTQQQGQDYKRPKVSSPVQTGTACLNWPCLFLLSELAVPVVLARDRTRVRACRNRGWGQTGVGPESGFTKFRFQDMMQCPEKSGQ